MDESHPCHGKINCTLTRQMTCYLGLSSSGITFTFLHAVSGKVRQSSINHITQERFTNIYANFLNQNDPIQQEQELVLLKVDKPHSVIQQRFCQLTQLYSGRVQLLLLAETSREWILSQSCSDSDSGCFLGSPGE